MEDLKRLLTKKTNQIGKRQITAAGVVTSWEVAKDVLPDKIFQASRAISFKSGVLKVGVNDAGYANLIVLYQDDLKSAVNRKLGKDMVERIIFKIGKPPADTLK
jgi:hypothetical protein